MLRYTIFFPVMALAACSFERDSSSGAHPTPVAHWGSATAVAIPTLSTGPTIAQRNKMLDETDPTKLRDPFGEASAARCYDCTRTFRPFGNVAVEDLFVLGTAHDTRDGSAIIANASGESQIISVGTEIGREVRRDGESIVWRVDRIRDGEVVLVEARQVDKGATRAEHVLRESPSAKG